MHAALENFRQMQVPHRMVILGDMKELGKSSIEEHQKVITYLKTCPFERIVLVGPEFAAIPSGYEHYQDVYQLIETLKQEKPEGYTILIKGSNSMKLSQLPDYL